ncbi:NUDIX domain-containing protein [Youngiibacter fragilis]|uniref:NUDIX hydrolase n=1 Tax=Youngiibacter fragilis 232.1 TaxID=994573 RepID=V7I6I2_9CLOT|nr:NUDIX domain-containing protein [Youngiibacter fragilis]ETA80906.1 NUDIX hydrolase [Youngiibacter fragilis 232.1]
MDRIENQEPEERWDRVMKRYASVVAVVFCYIVKDGKILLIRRGNPPSYNEYTVVGGKKEVGEDLIAACRREVAEETNLDVRNLEFRGVVHNHMAGRDFEVITFYFKTEDFTGELRSGSEGDLEWCSIDESFHKDGISEYYLRITPLVLGDRASFVGSISIDGEGKIERFEIS